MTIMKTIYTPFNYINFKNIFLKFKYFLYIKNIKHYADAKYSIKDIINENRNRALIYQWTCNITQKIYIGRSSNGSARLRSYFYPRVLRRNLPIYKRLVHYFDNNHSLFILEYVGNTKDIIKEDLLVIFL